MTDVLIPIALLVNIVTLATAIGCLRSSRRSEGISENRYDLLRDQHDQLELLREERRMLVQELKRESRARQQLIGVLEEIDPEIVEKLELEQQDSSERKETYRQGQESRREREGHLTETRQNEEQVERNGTD